MFMIVCDLGMNLCCAYAYISDNEQHQRQIACNVSRFSMGNDGTETKAEWEKRMLVVVLFVFLYLRNTKWFIDKVRTLVCIIIIIIGMMIPNMDNG